MSILNYILQKPAAHLSFSGFGKLILAFLSIISYPAQNMAQTSRSEEIDQVAANLYEAGKIYGGIFVAEGDSIIYNKAFGLSDKEAKTENSENALFPINSMTKPFTAVLVLQLYEEGLVKLDDPISRYVPEFKHPRANDITIHHLLSHRSGLQDYFLLQLNGELDYDITWREMLEKISATELEFEPGTAFSYNNTGYVLLALLVEKQRQSSFREVLEEYIFEPLKMTNSTCSSTDKIAGAVKLYDQSGKPARTNHYFIGDAGIFSTTKDLHKFLLAVNSNHLLGKEIWKLALTPHSFPEEARREFPAHYSPYGYGFNLTEWPYEKSVDKMTASHGGTGFGSSSYMSRFIDSERIIIFWNNQYKSPFQPIIFETVAR